MFFGWYIVAASSGIMFLMSALMEQAFGGYAAALARDYGWSRTALGGAFSASRLLGSLTGYPQGQILDRVGPRAVMRVGLVIFAAGFFLFARIDSLAMFYVASIVMAVGANIGGFLGISVVVVNWFHRYRARAMGLSFLGFAAGGLAAPLVILAITTNWRLTAVASGVAVLAIGLPLTALLHHKPEARGLHIDGVSAEEAARRAVEAAEDTSNAGFSFTVREAVRTRAFWMIASGHGSALLVVSAVQVHLFLHLTASLGYTDALAATILAVMTGAQVVGQFTGAYLGDRVSKRLIVVVCMGMHTTALLLVAWVPVLPAIIVGVVLHGAAWGARGPLMGGINADYFGRGSFGAIFGISTTFVTIGVIAGPIIAGALYDATGSYATGFTTVALLAALGSVFFVLATRPALPSRARAA